MSIIIDGSNSGTAIADTATQTLSNKTLNQPIINGVTTNSSAGAGQVGEYVESVVAGVTVNTTNTNMTTISLTAGDWDVSGTFGSGTGGTNTYGVLSISQTSATMTGGTGKDQMDCSFNTTAQVGSCSIPPYRISLSGSATLYLVAKLGTATSTSCYGRISARRVR